MADKNLFNYEKLVRAFLSQGVSPEEIHKQYKIPLQDIQRIVARIESEKEPTGPEPKRTRSVPVTERATTEERERKKFEWNPPVKLNSDIEREREEKERDEQRPVSDPEPIDDYVSPENDEVRTPSLPPEKKKGSGRLSRMASASGRGAAAATAYGLERYGGIVGRSLGSRIRKAGGTGPSPQIGLGRMRYGGSPIGVISAIDDAAKGVIDAVKKAEEAVARALGGVAESTREASTRIVTAIDEISSKLERRGVERREDSIEGRREEIVSPDDEKPSGSMSGAALGAALGAGAGLLGTTGKSEAAIDRNEKVDPYETPVNPRDPDEYEDDEGERELEFKADEIVFDADEIVFTRPLTSPSGGEGGGSPPQVGPDGDRLPPPQGSDTIETPGPRSRSGGPDEPASTTRVNRRLLDPERMSPGPHPSYVDSDKFTPGDVGKYRKIDARRRTGGGVGTRSSAVRGEGGKVMTTADTSMKPHQRALLDTIAIGDPDSKGYWESPGYDRIVGSGGTFDDFSRHPGKVGFVGPKGASTAAGRYQFTKTTWKGVVEKYNRENPDDPITDFSPRNQDRAAYWLAKSDYRRRTGRDLDADLQSEDPKVRDMVGQLVKSGLGGSGSNTTWEIFQRKTGKDVQRAFEKNLARNKEFEGVHPRLIQSEPIGPVDVAADTDAISERFGPRDDEPRTTGDDLNVPDGGDERERDASAIERAYDDDAIQKRIDDAFRDDSIQKRIDGAFADLPDYRGSEINRISTEMEAEPMTVPPPPAMPETGGGVREKTRNQLESSKDDSPPSTRLDDHFSSFPGMGKSGAPGLGY